MTLLRKFLRKNPAQRVGRGGAYPADLRPLSPGTEGPQAGQPKSCPWISESGVCLSPRCECHSIKPEPWQRRADKKRGNCPINETRAYRRVHSILAEGPNNG